MQKIVINANCHKNDHIRSQIYTNSNFEKNYIIWDKKPHLFHKVYQHISRTQLFNREGLILVNVWLENYGNAFVVFFGPTSNTIYKSNFISNNIFIFH